MGVGADILEDSYAAFIVGFLIGIISSWMFEIMPKFLMRFKIQDVAGVLNLHGVPGMLGGFCAVIYRKVYTNEKAGV